MHSSNFIDLTGQRFGKLIVLEISNLKIKKNGGIVTMWKCQCDCGKVKNVSGSDLRQGKTTSCGCYRKEHNRAVQQKSNRYDLTGEYGICYFNNGGFFIFDLEDYELLKSYTWTNRKGYASSCKRENGKPIPINAHRLIMGVIDSNLEIDHINGEPSDNRKINLRIVNHVDNMKNRKLSKRNKSGYTGVSQTKNGKWRARIRQNKQNIWLGVFETKEEATQARKDAEEKYFGDFTRKQETN